MPLMEALELRRTTREFSTAPLSPTELSDLVWAAFGINRPETGGRTAPSAWDHQEIDIYVITGEAAYLYQPSRHVLQPVRDGDLRELACTEDFARQAPVELVYVADHSRMPRTRAWERERTAYIDTGFIGQNVYLYCASAGLATVIHESADVGALAEALELRGDQQVIIAQAVGHPAVENGATETEAADQ
jgi:nitroreductase